MIKNPVLELMIDQGGKFERRLAELYFAADTENSATLVVPSGEFLTAGKNWQKPAPAKTRTHRARTRFFWE
jgi:hypothetical protein